MKHLHHVRIIRVTITDEPTPKDSTGCDGVYADSEDITEQVKALVEAAEELHSAERAHFEHICTHGASAPQIGNRLRAAWAGHEAALAALKVKP